MSEPHPAAVTGRAARPAFNGHLCPYHPASGEQREHGDGQQTGPAAPLTCSRDLGSNLTLVLVLPVLLVCNFLELWTLHMTARQALAGLIGPAVLAITVIHARSTLATVGRKFVDMIKSS